MFFTARLGTVVSAAALALTLTACVADDMALDDSYVPLSPSERYPIEFAKGPVTLEVATTQGILQPSQANAVVGFARQSMAGGQAPVTIRRPAGGGASKRVAEEVAGLILQQGVSRDMIHMVTYPAPASAPVQMGYIKAYAHTKACGDWSVDGTDTKRNEHMPNHGCAVQSNIAAMIADPDDLVTPEPTTPIPAAAGTEAVRKVSNGQGSARSSLFSLF